MSYCTRCGTKFNDSDEKFCVSCGAERLQTEPSSKSGWSEKPGALPPNISAARQAPQSREPSPGVTRSQPARERTVRPLVLVVGALFAVAVICVALAVITSPKTSTNLPFDSTSPMKTEPDVGGAPPSSATAASGDSEPNGTTDSWCRPDLPGGSTLVAGNTGPAVEALQQGLALLKYETFDSSGRLLPVTGDYNAMTVAAVKRFQYNHGLPETGSVDQTTWSKINSQLRTWGSSPAC